MGRTQDGNNNTYCQDNELSWMDWELDAYEMDMLWFTQSVIALRRDHPIFRRRRFLQGTAQDGADSALPDVEWRGTDGALMTDEDWNNPQNKCLTMFLNGSGIPEPNLRGERIVDDSALVMFNASGNPVDFTLPPADHGREWRVELGTGDTLDVGGVLEAGTTLSPPGHSLLILMRPPMPDDGQDHPAPAGARPPRARDRPPTPIGPPGRGHRPGRDEGEQSPVSTEPGQRPAPSGRESAGTTGALPAVRPVPTSTYRLQLHAGFTADDAVEVVPYLARLGVGHVFCSPVLQAAPGSTHGYDVVDHSRVSEEIGGEEALRRLAEAAHAHGMGLIADVVPNHMAIPTPIW